MPQPAPGTVPRVAALYETEINAAYEYAKTLYADSTFVHHSTSKGAQISTKESPNSAMPITKGEAVFPAKFTIEDILATLRHVDARKVWDARFEDMEIVEEYGDELRQWGLVHSYQKGQFLVSGRDFIVTFKIFRTPTHVYFVQTSAPDPRFPASKSLVRGQLYLGVWVMAPQEDGSTLVTYITHVDPAGTIPQSILRIVVAETPGCVGAVREYLEKHGAPKE
ncbi:hypothetical protein HDU97_001338 [Phlyctochytrium planicorne]|nr:hypothetical protein HDU97_001338 [Phlyctochytrium planicorne]